jgi:hypothetical protein
LPEEPPLPEEPEEPPLPEEPSKLESTRPPHAMKRRDMREKAVTVRRFMVIDRSRLCAKPRVDH